jgi:hypothetical protein
LANAEDFGLASCSICFAPLRGADVLTDGHLTSLRRFFAVETSASAVSLETRREGLRVTERQS